MEGQKVIVLGLGACGGKIANILKEKNVVPAENIHIINSTIQDKPTDDINFINIGNPAMPGCAKNPANGRKLMVDAIQRGHISDELFPEDTTKVIVITSISGGTGCGGATILPRWIYEVCGLRCHIFAIRGFNEGEASIKNEVFFYKNLYEDATVSIICNDKFLDEAGGNQLKAEGLCNIEVANQISVIMGNCILPSEKNIDQRDLFRLTTAPGLINICYKELAGKIKNKDEFNKIIKDMADNSKSCDLTNPQQTYLGIIINLPETEQNYIDYEFRPILDQYSTSNGDADARFIHVQHVEAYTSFIAFINSGMALPIEDVNALYTSLMEIKSKRTDRRNSFFDTLKELDMSIISDEDDEDLVGRKRPKKVDSTSFFDGLESNKNTSKRVSVDFSDNF